MKDKNLGIPINQEEIQHYLKDIRRIKVMTPDREKELAVKMKSDDTPKREREKIESEKQARENLRSPPFVAARAAAPDRRGRVRAAGAPRRNRARPGRCRRRDKARG